MTPKQQYTRAYSAFRRSKGSACLHSTPATRAAWATFTARFWFVTDYDPLTIKLSAWRVGLSEVGLPYAKSKIKMLVRFSTDFYLSEVAKL